MNILELTLDDLISDFETFYDKGRFHAEGVYRGFYKDGVCIVRNLAEFEKSQELAKKISNDLQIDILPIKQKKSSEDTIKFTTQTKDNCEFESVIISMKKYKTICISSQIGCKMGCRFCETGKMGFIRSLTTAEIVGQIYQAKLLWGYNIKNIVFMGMGEPLDNFDNVMKAISIFTEPRGLNFNLSNITISTVGNPLFIEKLGLLNLQNLNLAISINAPNDIIRSSIMPINKIYSMEMLKKAMLKYPLKKSATFFIEYVLIKEVNDSIQCADELASFLCGLNVKINLIPYNASSNSEYMTPDDKTINNFYKHLTFKGLFVRKRVSKGDELKAACGQLTNT